MDSIMNWKKLAALTLSLSMSLPLAACSGGSASTPAPTATPAPADTSAPVETLAAAAPKLAEDGVLKVSPSPARLITPMATTSYSPRRSPISWVASWRS